MPSLAATLLGVAVQVPFGAVLPVHVAGAVPKLSTGSMVGDFVVSGPPRPLAGGGAEIDLRPAALGTLSIPLPGHPMPATVTVVPTTDAKAAPAPLVLPRVEPPVGWLVAIAVVVLLFALFFRRRRERRAEDPTLSLRGAIGSLADPAGWLRHDAADTLAAAVRAFLSRTFSAPYQAMTTREIAAALPIHADVEHAVSLLAALELCDAMRFSGLRPRPQTAAEAVRGVLATASALSTHEGGR